LLTIAFTSDEGADVRVCVGEWSGHDWYSTEIIHWRRLALSFVTGQRRSPACCWLSEWPHSVAEQSTGTATRPHWKQLSSQATESNTTLLQWLWATTVLSTRQQKHLRVQPPMTTNDFITVPLFNSAPVFTFRNWMLPFALPSYLFSVKYFECFYVSLLFNPTDHLNE